MTIDKIRAQIVANLWQTIAQSEVDLSSVSHEEQEILVTKIADSMLIHFDSLIDDEFTTVDPKEVTIEDDGHEFNPLTAPAPETGQSLENSKIGGLGLHLVRNLVADMRYTRTSDRNRLETWISLEEDDAQ